MPINQTNNLLSIQEKATAYLSENTSTQNNEAAGIIQDLLNIQSALTSEIEHLQQSTLSLKEERLYFSDFYNNQSEGIFHCREVASASGNFGSEQNFKIEMVNDRLCEIIGVKRRDLIANPSSISTIISSQDLFSFVEIHSKSRKQLIPCSWEGRITVRKKTVWVRVESCPRKIENGDIIWFGMLYNITEQKTTKETLDETLIKLAEVIEGAKIGTLEWNIQTGKINFNRIWAENLGYSVTEMKLGQLFLGKNGWKTITHPDDIPYAEEMLQRHFSGELPYHKVEVRMHHKKGHWVWIRQEGKVISWTPDGKPLLMYGTHIDVSPQKQAEEALNKLNEQLELRITERTSELMELNDSLRQTEVKFRTLTDFTYDWEYWKSPENQIIFMSPSVERITGYTVAEFEENPELIDSIIHPNDLDLWLQHKAERCHNEPNDENIELTFRIITKGGNIRWLGHVCRCITIDNKYLGVRVSNRDITEKVSADYRLMNITVDVEERERNRFSSELHDGMGPLLSTIKLYFQWLSDTSDVEKRKLITEKGNQSIEMAIQTARELAKGLNSRFLTEVGYIAAIRDFTDRINETSKSKIVFVANTEERFAGFLELMLYRITTELIKNSITYAQAECINIDFQLNSERKIVTFNYRDNGIGFDWEKVKYERKGLGLLNIMHRVQIMKGNINVASKPGEGMSVDILLPIEQSKIEKPNE